jgi:outer membrane immunogenic protein
MKIRYLVAASAFALVTASSVQAADIVHAPASPAPVAAPAFSWNGFYAGGEIGGSWARTKVNKWDAAGSQTNGSSRPNSFIGGLFAGYNFDIGSNVVLGLDTDFLWEKVKGQSSVTSGATTYKAEVKQKWVGSTRARLGYAADRWLPYVAAGVAYGRINTSVTGGDTFAKNKTPAGWTAGAGVDYAMTDNILLRLEYRYTDFGKKTYYNVRDSSNYRVKYKANDIRVGVAYKF